MQYIVDGDDLTAIADAIRAKSGDGGTIEVADMADAIEAIKTEWPGLLTPLEFDWNVGYVSGTTWVYEDPTDTYCDIYECVAGHEYKAMVGNTVGTRFRILVTDVDVREVTSGRITGTSVTSLADPTPLQSKTFTADMDGYMIFAKDNVGVSGIMTYVMDRTVV